MGSRSIAAKRLAYESVAYVGEDLAIRLQTIAQLKPPRFLFHTYIEARLKMDRLITVLMGLMLLLCSCTERPVEHCKAWADPAGTLYVIGDDCNMRLSIHKRDY